MVAKHQFSAKIFVKDKQIYLVGLKFHNLLIINVKITRFLWLDLALSYHIRNFFYFFSCFFQIQPQTTPNTYFTIK